MWTDTVSMISEPQDNVGAKWLKPALVVGAIVVGMLILKAAGVTQHLSPDNIVRVETAINGLGVWGPVAYILLYIVGVLLFLPGLALTAVAGVFGPVMGTLYVSLASTIGASLSFLAARYALRPMVEKRAQESQVFKRIDDGVAEHGWRMVVITRLIPLFPFNIQNYAYGLTKVRFPTYVLVSWLCMLPGTIAYVTAFGSIVGGKGDTKKTLMYLAIAAMVFVALSLAPAWLKKKYRVEEFRED